VADNPFLQYGRTNSVGVLATPSGRNRRDPLRENIEDTSVARGIPLPQDISQRGAPAKVRAAVASVQKNSDQLAALRKFYKDARPYGTDNFIFRDPKNENRWTIFNPRGVDTGDVAASGRLAANVVGGVLGGAVGSLAAPVAGTVVGGAAGATGAGVLFDKAVQAATGASDTRTAGQQATDAAIETGIGVAIPAVGGPLVRGARNFFRAGNQEAVEAAGRLGVNAPAAVTGSRGAQMTTAALDATVTSGGRMAQRGEKFVADMGQKVRDITAGTVGSKGEAGQIIRQSADDYVRNFRAESTRLYDEVDRLVPPTSQVAFDNFETTLTGINQRYGADPEFADLLADPFAKKLMDAAAAAKQRGGVSYETLKDLRSTLGKEINAGKGKILDFFGMADTNALYGSLTDDMAAAARQVGGQPGEQAAALANQFWKDGRRVVDTRIQPIVGPPRANKPAEKIYDTFIETAESAPSVLDDWKAVVPVQQREALGKFTASRLGNSTAATEGALVDTAADATFSPNSFVRGYNRVFNGADRAPARDFFFPDQGVLANVNDVFTLSSGARSAGQQANTSRTAAVTGTTGLLGGALTSGSLLAGGATAGDALLAGGAGTLLFPAAAPALARAMTSQTGERILSRPALQSAFPEITGSNPAVRGILGVNTASALQQPFRQEQNADTGGEENPFFLFGQPQ
jgi:hypothetical protein